MLPSPPPAAASTQAADASASGDTAARAPPTAGTAAPGGAIPPAGEPLPCEDLCGECFGALRPGEQGRYVRLDAPMQLQVETPTGDVLVQGGPSSLTNSTSFAGNGRRQTATGERMARQSPHHPSFEFPAYTPLGHEKWD